MRRLGPAVEALRHGDVIVHPGDTGYLFACRLSAPRAVAMVRRLKGLDERQPKPLSLMVSEFAALSTYGHLSNWAFRWLRRLLPGPYTVVLPARNAVPRSARNRDHEIGLRLPLHAMCTHFLAAVDEPLVTGSLTPADVLDEQDPDDFAFGSNVAVVVDGGPLRPEPSTVLRFVDDGCEVLRAGQGEVPDELLG